jgi:hypothetical protein
MSLSSNRKLGACRRRPIGLSWAECKRIVRDVIKSLVIGGGLLAARGIAAEAHAQEPQGRQLERPAASDVKSPEESSTNAAPAASTGSGPDLGRQLLLRRPPRPRRFRVYSDTQYLYNSNVLLADGEFIQEGEDEVFIQSFGASYSPPLVQPLTSTLYWRHDIARYDEFSGFNFDSDTGGLWLNCPVQDWFAVYGGFSASRSYFQDGGDEFYEYFDTQLGISREQPLTRRALLVYGYQFDWRVASPSELTRVDNAAYVGVNVALLDKLTGQLFYRARVRDYFEADRTDLDHLAALTLIYSFNDYVSVRLSATYGKNNSTENEKDYQVFTGGGGLNLLIKF